MSLGASPKNHQLALNRRTFVLGSLGVAGLSVLGAGCSGQSASPASQAEATDPARGGSLRVGVTSGVVPSNFFLGDSFGQQLISWFQFAWPLYMGAASGFEFNPGLAESYEGAPDGLTHTFTLRSGLTFHDGSPIDAEAVAENLRSYLYDDHPLRDQGDYFMTYSGFGNPPVVDRVKVVDERTVQMILTTPKINLQGDPLYQFIIINPKIMARKNYGTDPGALHDAGSGPFRLKRFEPSSFVEFERFDDFFEDVHLDQLRYQSFEDGAAMNLALLAGEVDAVIGPAQTDFDALSTDPSFQTITASDPGANIFLLFNTPQKPELEDARVREAIWVATNRAAYREAFFATGTAFPSTQPAILEGTEGYDPDLEERPHDPERARTLLAEAGVSDLTLKVYTTEANGPVAQLKNFWEAVTSDLAEVGITVDLTVTDDATVDAAEDWDIQFMLYDGIGPGILFLLYFMNVGAGFEPPDPRADPRVPELFNAAFDTADEAEQDRLLRELMRLDHEELMMAIPVALVAQSAITRQEVRDFRLSPLSNDPQNLTWVDAG